MNDRLSEPAISDTSLLAAGLFIGAENELSDDSRHGYENGIAWVLLALVPDILFVDIFPSLRNGDVRDK